jgi:hypothetical protein
MILDMHLIADGITEVLPLIKNCFLFLARPAFLFAQNWYRRIRDAVFTLREALTGAHDEAVRAELARLNIDYSK